MKKQLLPRSGSEPTNAHWYLSSKATDRANCYAYAFGVKGRKDGYKLQPGDKSGLKGVDFSLHDCRELVKRVRRDFKNTVYVTPHAQKPCRRGYAKVMAFIDPDRDFHFFRQDPNGFWSHKRGLTPVSITDACHRRIRNPQKACRRFDKDNDYTVLCGTFCRRVPETKKKSTRTQK